MVSLFIFVIVSVVWFALHYKPKHKHKWISLTYNRWYTSTSQECKCGLYREIHNQPDSKNISRNHYWYYSDGDITPDERVFKHV